MAITSPVAVKFANEKVRVMADQLVSTYETAKAFKSEWDANTLGSLFTNSAAEIVNDGADVDGRHQLTGQKATAMNTACSDIITWFEATVSGKTRIEWLRLMAVGGQPRF